MKNMKVSLKLIISFLIVIVMAVIVGAVGIIGMYQINRADDGLYNDNYLPTVMAGNISQRIVEQRTYMRNFVIYDVNADAETFKQSQDNMAAAKQEMEKLIQEYDQTIVNDDDRAAFNELVQVYRNEWLHVLDQVQELGTQNKTEEAKAALTVGATAANKMDELTTKLQEINLADGAAAIENNTKLFGTMTIIEVVVLVIAVAVAMFFALYISSLISKPLATLTAFMNKAGTTGDISLSQSDVESIGKFAQVKDEVGQCIGSTASFVNHLTEIGDFLGRIANGDLTVEIRQLSEHDTMGNALSKTLDNLNRMFSEINSSSNQVSTGSVQIADGAQLLAQGATEQSATVEELSASITQIAEQTKLNAGTANEAQELSENIRQSAEQGNRQMEQMMIAVQEINESSKSISKVIKIIDDIAFQTNILALNAAVEAARAGQHGKGFAVVADEVRSLAAKSAEAAKNTNELIETSIQKAEQGAAISQETSESLKKIVEGILHSSELISEIAKSSAEQSTAISQVSDGIEQVSQVVQQNSATAEQSAAASEEMSGQATLLQQLISQFKIKDASSYGHMSAKPASSGVSSVSVPASTGYALTGGDKY